MASFLPLNILTILLALFVTFGCCFNGDVYDEQQLIENNFAKNLEILEQQIKSEFLEIKQWLKRVEILEKHIQDAKTDRTEVLRRQKRGIRDPRYGMLVGKPGPPGLPGTPGVPGAVGRRGQKGHKGVAGPPGLRGPHGPYGPPGWKGPPGFIGTEGIKGEKGLPGFDGMPGLIGDVGLVGYNGEHGRMGPPGLMGHVGFIGMIGFPGPRGDPGIVGYTGPSGDQGSYGVPGPVGVYGEPGPMGEYGFMGPPGEIGYKGAKGERGHDGETGPWGPVGMPGPIYDPYAGFTQLAPIFTNHNETQIGNCTDLDEGVPNCSSFEGIPMAAEAQFSSKSLPAFYHLPPNAHVMPAQSVLSKFQMPGIPSKQYSPAYGPNIEYNEDENDILTEKEYLEMMKSHNISEGEIRNTEYEYEITEDSHNEVSLEESQEMEDYDKSSQEVHNDMDSQEDQTEGGTVDFYADSTTESVTVTTEPITEPESDSDDDSD